MHIIHGYHTQDGYNQGPGLYIVQVRDGRIYEADTQEELFVQQWGDDVPILTNGCWEFWPDQPDLTRLGLKPVQMIPAEG